MEVWTTTVDDGRETVTTVHANEQLAFKSLKDNYVDVECGDPDFDIETLDGRSDLVDWMTERCGMILYVDRHELAVPEERR